jgi:hypothetical protein
MLKIFLTWVVVILMTLPSVSLDRSHYEDLTRRIRESAKKQDWNAMRSALIDIGRELQDATPGYMVRMASVENRLGNKAQALTWMKRYAATGLNYDVKSDPGLKSLVNDKGFQEIAAEMRKRAKPVTEADVVCSLPLSDLMPEDITFDVATSTIIVSSIRHRTVYRVSLPKSKGKECALKEIAPENGLANWPVMAVSYDRMRSLLWLTACALPDFHGAPEKDSGKAALFAVNAANGKVMFRLAPETSQPIVLGDMLVVADGTLYVSDSIGGGVYRLPQWTPNFNRI